MIRYRGFMFDIYDHSSIKKIIWVSDNLIVDLAPSCRIRSRIMDTLRTWLFSKEWFCQRADVIESSTVHRLEVYTSCDCAGSCMRLNHKSKQRCTLTWRKGTRHGIWKEGTLVAALMRAPLWGPFCGHPCGGFCTWNGSRASKKEGSLQV